MEYVYSPPDCVPSTLRHCWGKHTSNYIILRAQQPLRIHTLTCSHPGLYICHCTSCAHFSRVLLLDELCRSSQFLKRRRENRICIIMYPLYPQSQDSTTQRILMLQWISTWLGHESQETLTWVWLQTLVSWFIKIPCLPSQNKGHRREDSRGADYLANNLV